MKKIMLAFALLFIALGIFAQVTIVSDLPTTPAVVAATAPVSSAAKVPFTDIVLITAAMAASILTVTQGIKKLLESPLLKWVLTIFGHAEVVPFIAVALSIITAIASGIVAYQAGGITIGEILAMIPTAWASATGGFSLIQKASGVPAKILR